ncbi:MAG: hypothetical protein ACRDTS_23360 [Mycobacterium sp.]
MPPGSVINQSPNHDSKAKIGSTVELFVATAPVVSSPPVQSPPASSPPASPTAAASP